MNKKYFVICGNRAEYMDFCTKKVNSGKHEDFLDFIYVNEPKMLRGHRNPQGYFYGSWRERKDILEIIEIILVSSDDDTLIRNNKMIREFFIQKAIA
jgi:hypothetical protein